MFKAYKTKDILNHSQQSTSEIRTDDIPNDLENTDFFYQTCVEDLFKP